MRKPRGRSVGIAAACGAALVLLGIPALVTASRLPIHPFLLSEGAPGTDPAASPPVLPPAGGSGTKLEGLPCFQCHSIERYRESEDFPHEVHADEVGHCHLCHAFEPHMQVTVRLATCDTCH